MLTTTPRLRIRRPSPTAVEFTVTTLPPSTLTFRILRTLLLVIRVGLALATATILHARWTECPLATPLSSYPQLPTYDPSSMTSLLNAYLSEDAFWALLAHLHTTSPARTLSMLATGIPTAFLVPAALALGYSLALRVHASESLLVMRGLGVQTSASPRTYLSRMATRFIPTEKIQDVFINEAFRGFEVRYYLVVVVEDEEDVVVVFPGLLPRRDIVERVWRGARECLWEVPSKAVDEKG